MYHTIDARGVHHQHAVDRLFHLVLGYVLPQHVCLKHRFETDLLQSTDLWLKY